MTTGRGLIAGRLSATGGQFGARELPQGGPITIEWHVRVRISIELPKAVITFLIPVCVSRD
jgi:hypothetical protein